MEEPEKNIPNETKEEVQLPVTDRMAKPKKRIVTSTMTNWYTWVTSSKTKMIVAASTLIIVLTAVVAPLAYRSLAAENTYDFVITSVTSTPVYPQQGQAVTFSATVKNIGGGASPAGVILGTSFSVGGKKVAWSDNFKNSLAPGASTTLTATGGPDGNATWTFPGGNQSIEAYVDDLNRLDKEITGDNNKFTFKFGYDLTVSNVSNVPDNPKAGDHVVFSATIKNSGNLPSPDGVIHGVAFQIDGNTVTWSDTYKKSIVPGGSVDVTANNGPNGVNYWTMVAGKTSVTAYVDDINRMPDEISNDNNKTTGPLAAPAPEPKPAPAPAPTPTPTPTPPPVTSASTCSGAGNAKVGDTRGGLVGFANGYRYGQLSSSDKDKYIGIYTDVGARWYRMNMEYWNMDEYKDIIARTKAKGICVFGNISANKSGDHWHGPSTSAEKDAWAKAAADEVAQLKGDVHVWEIWNEENISFWTPSPSPSNYADLLHRTYVAIKAVDPSAIVLGGGLAPQGDGTDPNNSVNYWKKVYDWNKSQGRQGSYQLFDGLAHHPYYYPGDPTSPDKLKDWSGFYQTYLIHQNLMCNGSYGGPTNDCAKKIWGTEGGFPTECSDTSYCQSLSTAASYVPKMMDMWQNDWGSFTGPFMWYQPQNQPNQTGHELYMGWVRNDSNWTRKDPMFSALRTYDKRTN